jgi:sugar (pentulose or hexulose) kinase/ribose/xylose/arabinose/galactoside ABC-type transport system permease subunit
VKAVLMSPSGDVRASATTPLALTTLHPGWAEQDPLDWWEASVASIRAARSEVPDATIAAVGISGQMHSSVFLDRGGDVVRPALLWCDGRTTEECREIERRVGGEARLRDLVSNPALEGFTLPKVLWLRNHEPEAFPAGRDGDARQGLHSVPFDGRAGDGTLRRVGDADVRHRANALEQRDSRRDGFERVAAAGSGRLVGGARSRQRRRGRRLRASDPGTPVVGGGADNACGAAGVGVVAPGEAVASWGTSGTLLAPMSEPRVDPGLRAHTFCHVVPNTWYLMGVVLSAGGAFAWYRDQLARELAGDPEADHKLDDEAASVSRGAEGVSFLPYLQGERTPHRNATARGALLGLSLAHTRAHVTRAVIEGVCFALRDSLEIPALTGIHVERSPFSPAAAREVRSFAGCSPKVFGIPVATVNREEGPGLRSGAVGRRWRRRVSGFAGGGRHDAPPKAGRGAVGGGTPRVRRAVSAVSRELSRVTSPPPVAFGRRMLASQETGLVIVVALVVITLTALAGSHADRVSGTTVNNFLNSNTLIQVATDASFFAIMAIGATIVIISGGIDLSVGSIYALAGVSMALALRALGQASPGTIVVVGLVTCVGVGLLCGLLNGNARRRAAGAPVHHHARHDVGSSRHRVRGNQGESILVPFSLTGVTKASLGLRGGLYPVPMLVMIAVTILGTLYLTRTVMGRHIFAFGGNIEASRFAGLALGRIQLGVFAVSGLTAGLAAFLGASLYGSASSGDAQGYELYVIASAVVGGASLIGGKGSAIGAMLGALLIVLIRQSIRTLHFDQNYEWIVIGCAIIVAVVIDRWSAGVTRAVEPQCR